MRFSNGCFNADDRVRNILDRLGCVDEVPAAVALHKAVPMGMVFERRRRIQNVNFDPAAWRYLDRTGPLAMWRHIATLVFLSVPDPAVFLPIRTWCALNNDAGTFSPCWGHDGGCAGLHRSLPNYRDLWRRRRPEKEIKESHTISDAPLGASRCKQFCAVIDGFV